MVTMMGSSVNGLFRPSLFSAGKSAFVSAGGRRRTSLPFLHTQNSPRNLREGPPECKGFLQISKAGGKRGAGSPRRLFKRFYLEIFGLIRGVRLCHGFAIWRPYPSIGNHKEQT
jgi:hypothetical protein